MYRRILVAARTDCAVRLIRACHDEGAQAFLVSSRDDDHGVAHEHADGVVFTGMSREAYTAEDDILEAARRTNCEAILPGWGFLSEEYAFARRCRFMGIHFIGPKSNHLQIFGDKLKTIQTLCGTLPDSVLPCRDGDFRTRLDKTRGPWMLKGRFGGGGKNIERFDDRALIEARLEVLAASGALSRYYVEPAVDDASHLEFQVFGDGRGRVEIVGARDCSPQRHHQKWLETSLDLGDLPPNLCDSMEQMRNRLAQLGYFGWGTVEFLVSSQGQVHLLELNPRLQVEHGVTEMTTGIDLVRTAIRLSCGGNFEFCRTLPVASQAVEYRLFAEKTGTIRTIGFAGHPWPSAPDAGVCWRIESGYRSGDRVTGVYDGLVARFMVGTNAKNAHETLKKWLSTFVFEMV